MLAVCRICLKNTVGFRQASECVRVHHVVEDQPMTQRGRMVLAEVRTPRTFERGGRRERVVIEKICKVFNADVSQEVFVVKLL